METRVVGHVLVEHIHEMTAGYLKNGAGTIWLVDASETDSYDAGAIRAAIDDFGALGREHGLVRLVALITQPGVRMGASVVAMSLRAVGARLSIDVVGDRESWVRAGQ